MRKSKKPNNLLVPRSSLLALGKANKAAFAHNTPNHSQTLDFWNMSIPYTINAMLGAMKR